MRTLLLREQIRRGNSNFRDKLSSFHSLVSSIRCIMMLISVGDYREERSDTERDPTAFLMRGREHPTNTVTLLGQIITIKQHSQTLFLKLGCWGPRSRLGQRGRGEERGDGGLTEVPMLPSQNMGRPCELRVADTLRVSVPPWMQTWVPPSPAVRTEHVGHAAHPVSPLCQGCQPPGKGLEGTH